MRRLENREGTIYQEIQKEMENRGGPHAVLVVNTRGAHPAWEGMYMDEIARELGVDPVDAVIRVALETKTVGECIYFSMDQQDVLNIMKEPYICVGSDGNALAFDKNFTKSNVHPRHFAAFSQFFQTVRENSLMPIEQAVHKTTGLAAQIMNISDRGILAEGTPVFKGMKAGDIDPRCALEHCYCASDKALAVGGGVLEAVLQLKKERNL